MLRPYAPPVRPFTFFIITYLVSWSIWIPLALYRFDVGLHIPAGTRNAVSLLGVLMPAVTALILSARAGGFAGVRSLLRPLKTWRTGWGWWAAAVLVWPLLLVVAAAAYNRSWPDSAITPVAWTSLSAVLVSVFFLLVATLGEEIGWRGLALPAMEQRSSALRATVLLGLLWAAWHIPYWLLQDTYTRFGIAYLALSFLFVVPGAFYITWFYNHGRFSLLLPVAFHVSFNIVNVAWLPVTANLGAFGVLIALDWVIAILLWRHLEPSSSPGRRSADVQSNGLHV
jgi:uncharacterized protein